MADIDLELLDDAKIERMIFHIINREKISAEILEEVEDPRVYEEFFIERLKETTKGASYKFNTDSVVQRQLIEAATNPHAFSDCSEILANHFHNIFLNDSRLIPGVIMIFKIIAKGETYAAIIKYDDIRVISYKTAKTTEGKRKPILDFILNTFVQDRKALQKSAIVKLSDTKSLYCIDRSGKNGDITEKYKQFLDVQREFNHDMLTDRLLDALVATIKKHKGILPKEIGNRSRMVAKEALSSLDTFDPTASNELLTKIFGDHSEKEQLKSTLIKELKKQKIQHEKVKIAKSKVTTPKKMIKETIEGIRIIYEQSHVDQKLIEFYEENGEKLFKGKTLEYEIEDEYRGKN